eukprot:m.125414 g.125414  ORF g.125414 m.125414 type:complete len:394 (-) comp9690_c0_seq2:363-1544(-)
MLRRALPCCSQNANQTRHSSVAYIWEVIPAFASKDIAWRNLRYSHTQRQVRTFLAHTATYLLVFFYTIPIAFVASLTTLEELAKIKFLHWLTDVIDSSPVVKGFLEGFLPTLALQLFMMFLPAILKAFSKAEGLPSWSTINLAVLRKLYIFNVVNVFFVSLIAGSALANIKSMVEDTSSILPLLGNAIPATGNFFINYVMLEALSVFPLELLQLGPLIVSWFKLKYLAKTEREREEAEDPGPYDYGVALPSQLLVILVGLTYSTVAPAIIPFLIFYFFFGYVTYRHQLFYVFVSEYETGGLYWKKVFHRVMCGILLSELTIIGVMGVKKGYYQSPLMIPLVLATILFWRSCISVCRLACWRRGQGGCVRGVPCPQSIGNRTQRAGLLHCKPTN